MDSFYDVTRVSQRVELLRRKYSARDARLADVQAVRRGDFEHVAPDLFSDEFPRPIVANLIDSSARHIAAALAPLPTFNCSSSSMLSEQAKKFADRRGKIANSYIRDSRVKAQMQRAADQFFTYGMIAACVEPDFKESRPNIVFEDSIGLYPVWDRKGRTVEVARVFFRDSIELQAEYPDHAEKIKEATRGSAVAMAGKVEVVKYVSDDEIVVYLPRCHNMVLERMANPLGRCYYVCRAKPGLDDEIRGAFDDLIWVQLARHKFQMLALEAADKAVRAPLVVPTDVADVPLGPDAVIRTQAGAGAVARARLDVPPQTWMSIDHLRQEMQTGSIVPEALSGSIDASVITGKGVQQLAAGYSQQIAAAQDVLVGMWEDVVELCFRMDEALWPDTEKTVRGQDAGVPYTVKYKAGKDIDGDYTVDVSYGFLAGLDPNRALVYLLQAQGAGLLSDDYVRRNLPAGINAAEETQKVQIEQMQKTLIQMMSALAQAVPGMAMNGMDPTQVVMSSAKAIEMLRKGKPIEDVVLEVFVPKQPEPTEAAAGDPAAAAAEAAGGGAAGIGPGGFPSGLTPGEMEGGPNERPDLQMMFAGLSSSGNPVLQGGVSRYTPVAS